MDNLERDKVFDAALDAAIAELAELEEQERNIASRKANLRLTVNALWPVVFKQPLNDINALSLPDAMRLILRSAGRPLNANDYRTKLTDLGFDLSKFDNPLANIHTAMKRMVDSEEFQWVEEGSKQVVPGPELKPVPEAEELSADVLKGLMDGLTGGNEGS